MDGVGSLDWYNEFGDALRKAEIPAVTQRVHMQRAIEYIRADFGATPHVIRPGGSLYSKSRANNTALIAAQMGLGVATWDGPVYLGKDLVLSLDPVSRRRAWKYNQQLAAADLPWGIDGPTWLSFHDRDLSLDHGSVARLLDTLGDGIGYMSGAEYSAYLHTAVGRGRGEAFQFVVDYDGHYCDWFDAHASRWTVHFSDEMRRQFDGQVPERQSIELSKGTGTRVLWTGKLHGTPGNQASR